MDNNSKMYKNMFFKKSVKTANTRPDNAKTYAKCVRDRAKDNFRRRHEAPLTADQALKHLHALCRCLKALLTGAAETCR